MPGKEGRLVLVVGPSGAGKDSMLRGAASELADQPRYIFPRRLITRQADVSAEDHDTLSELEFHDGVARGAFMLHWQAHGLGYAIPGSVEDATAAGKVAVVNVSRNILHAAATRFPNLTIVEITADPELRMKRIAARGREDMSAVKSRALRETEPFPDRVAKFSIENSGTLEQAIAQFVAILKSL
jgi:ribose 1,5-bisphosphokinase